jgi:hypothetical protein
LNEGDEISPAGMTDWRAVVVVPPMDVLMVIDLHVPSKVETAGDPMDAHAVALVDAAEANAPGGRSHENDSLG